MTADTDNNMNRRNFTRLTALASALPISLQSQDSDPKYKVAVIGHTGRGNFGHGLDVVWMRNAATGIVAVADADEAGLKKAGEKLKVSAENQFLDYRKMLEETRPDIVAVCPRHVDQHKDMCLAAIQAGAKGIYIEKPFLQSPAEVDEVLAAARKSNTKIAVAHRNRYHPALETISGLIGEEPFGKLLEIRGRGKGDRRGGGEDLWVLGSHVLNLMTYFGGEVKTCSANVLKDGKRVTADDVYEGAEGLGPLAGNEVHARYLFDSGITGTFDSIAEDGTGGNGFGLQLIGSTGIINIRCDKDPLAHFIPGNPFLPTAKERPWIPITSDGIGKPESRDDAVKSAANHDLPVQDLIQAIEEDRPPLCSAADGAKTVEMICAVFSSHQQNSAAVSLPLQERENALSKL